MLSKKTLHLLARQPASRKSRRIAQAKAWAIDFQITHDSAGVACDARERSLIGQRPEVLGSIPRRRRAAASELWRPSLLLLEVMPFRLAGTLTFL
jgi:hypothetical protein